MIAALASIRAHAPLLTIAYALVWAKALEHAGEGLLGLLVAGAHTLLVWLWFVGAARSESEAGLGSRLGLSREPEGAPIDPLAWTGLLLSMLFGALCLALLAASWRVGLGFLAAGGLTHWHGRSCAVTTRYRGLEALGPAVALALPGLIIAANLPDESAHATPTTPLIGVSCLGAVALGAFVIAALARDGLQDAARGVPTVATRMGVSGAGKLAWVWMLATMALAMIGAGWDWWHWSAGVIAGIGAGLAGWSFAKGNPGGAGVAWFVAAVAMSIAVGVSVISPA